METRIRLQDIKPANSLIFKLPEEKDPVICLCFANEFEAQKTNQDLVEKWSHEIYSVRLMPGNNGGDIAVLNLMLVGDNNQRLYKGLAFDQHKLNWWLQYVQGYKYVKFKFCHVVKKNDRITAVKAYGLNKWFVLKVSKVVVMDLRELSY
jgi:hypothetical protein